MRITKDKLKQIIKEETQSLEALQQAQEKLKSLGAEERKCYTAKGQYDRREAHPDEFDLRAAYVGAAGIGWEGVSIIVSNKEADWYEQNIEACNKVFQQVAAELEVTQRGGVEVADPTMQETAQKRDPYPHTELKKNLTKTIKEANRGDRTYNSKEAQREFIGALAKYGIRTQTEQDLIQKQVEIAKNLSTNPKLKGLGIGTPKFAATYIPTRGLPPKAWLDPMVVDEWARVNNKKPQAAATSAQKKDPGHVRLRKWIGKAIKEELKNMDNEQ
tara:strand:+ start:4866 stop:5684 length:819 start_codon:yes stop_codon:yes gene_type:complete